MANNINWGKIYCDMEQDNSFGADTLWSTNAINDIASATCWITFALRADSTLFQAANKLITADRTQL